MKVLALDSSTMLGSVAVISDGKVIAESRSMRERSHSESINPMVEDVLAQAGFKLEDIDLFATGQGPGSFTGIRVSANIAKTFCYSYNKPLFALDSLANIAWQYGQLDRPIMPMINAYKNMVYTAIYNFSSGEPETILPPSAIPVRELKNYLNQNVYAVGDGWNDFNEYFHPSVKERIARPDQIYDYPTAATLGIVAELKAKQGFTTDWKSFVPLYIRASEAEETKKGMFITPLQ